MNVVHGMRGTGGVGAALVLSLYGVCNISKAAEEPPSHKPTLEELEQRIRILEEKLAAQQQGSAVQPSSQAAQPPQTPASPAAEQRPVVVQGAQSTTESGPQIFAGPGGFSFQSADGANQIRFHGEFDFDGRFFNDASTPDSSRSTWLLRRARPIVEGTFLNIFDFRFNPDFAGGKTVIQDAFLAARLNPLFIVTAGKFKEPFGLERLQLSPNNRFIELGLPSDLVPNRDLGVQVSGTYAFATGSVTYQVGWFNGTNDGVSTDANVTPDVDNNDDKDWVARLFATPFSTSGIDALRGIGAGVAVSYVNQVGSPTNTLLPSYRTESQRNFFSYEGTRAATATVPAAAAAYADGERLRISPQAYYYFRSLGLLAEYVSERQDVARAVGGGAGAFVRQAQVHPSSWQAYATYLLTGEDATFGTVVPKQSFAVGRPGWGAVELAARISELNLNRAAFSNPNAGSVDAWFADPSENPNKALAWTAGINWYLTQNVAWYVDFTHTRFDGGAPLAGDRLYESAFFTRVQMAF